MLSQNTSISSIENSWKQLPVEPCYCDYLLICTRIINSLKFSLIAAIKKINFVNQFTVFDYIFL